VISFIITAFNRPLALRTCLSSIVQQTNEDWMGMVMDNSDDPVLAKRNKNMLAGDFERFSYNHVSGETHVEDSMHKYSLYKATEIGVRVTYGDWLCFPNDDSYYCPWFAERMLRAAESSQWDLVYCDIVMGGPKSHNLLEAHPRLCQIDKTNFLLRRNWFQGFSKGHGDDYPQADGYMIEELVRRGIRHGRVPQVLVTHN